MIKINKNFIFILILSFIGALLLGGNLPYAIFYTFVVTFIIEFIYIFKVIGKLNIFFKWKKKSYTVGEQDSLQVLVKNYSMPYIYIINDGFKMFNPNYNGHCLYVDSDGSQIMELKLDFKTRGIYDLGKFHIKAYDLFNIFSINKDYYIENYQIKIYPKVYPISGNWVFGDGTCDSRNINRNFNEDTSLLKDVRKYVTGDSLKRVHWKLSAKHKELYVKNFENTSGKLGNIFLNMSQNSFLKDDRLVLEDKCIEAAASLINYMNNKGIRSKVFISDLKKNKFEIYNRQSFNEFMEQMVTQKSDGEFGFCNFISMNLKHVSYGGLIYVITPKVNEELWEKLCGLINKNYRVTLLYYVSEIYNAKYIEALGKMGVKAININSILN